MGDTPGSPSQFVTRPSTLWRIRHSPATSEVAMILVVALSALWLVAAATAQVWYHSVAPCIRQACPPSPSYTGLHVWLVIGTFGAVLALGSLALVARAMGGRRQGVSSNLHRVLWGIVLAGCAGVLVEFVLVHLVTDHAMATAPLGFNNSGEGAAAIAVLAVAQPVLVGFLVLAWSRLLPTVGPEHARARRRRWSWFGPLGLVGMVITCGAFAAWSLRDGTTLIVNTTIIAGRSGVANVGAWWPGLFAAMAALTVVALACAPGIVLRTEGGAEPVVPSMSDERKAPAAVRR
jgi:hypothetical protein